MFLHKDHSLQKAVILSLGILMMLPVATSWQSMFGSVQKAIVPQIAVESAVEEKNRLEEEIVKMQEQMAKLTALIEQLEQSATAE